MNKEKAASIARIILQQLGGNKFIAMTGASNFIVTESGLGFRIPSKMTKDKITHVIVVYDEINDLYQMSFMKFRGSLTNTVAEVNDIYCDQLQSTFTEYTGLYTSL